MIKVEHLSKYYGDHLAVDDLSFEVEKNHIYGFLGPNGAGKSTTMNIITGCLSLSDGSVEVGGHDIFEEPEEAKKLIGYLPELPPLYVDETLEEYLYFVAEAKGVKKENIKDEVERVIEITKINNVRNRLIKFLSKGYRQRVGIAEALIGNPEIIILDEPTVGLDPMQIIEIRELIKGLKENHTVILSSHILSEVQSICDKILIINQGKLVAFDTPENLEKLFVAKTEIELLVEGNVKKIIKSIEKIENVKECSIDSEDKKTKILVSLTDDNDEEVRKKLFMICKEQDIVIYQMNTNSASLEDVFIELTKVEEGDKDDCSTEA